MRETHTWRTLFRNSLSYVICARHRHRESDPSAENREKGRVGRLGAGVCVWEETRDGELLRDEQSQRVHAVGGGFHFG